MGTGDSGRYYTSGGSRIVHHPELIHSIDGNYRHDKITGRPDRMKSGGHGQASIEIMEKNGIEYRILKTCKNGVRVGNIPDHSHGRKRSGTTQTWFPKSWTTQDMVKAAEHVASLKKNQNQPNGSFLWGTYKGVRVGIIKRDGRIHTIFPSEKQPNPKKKGNHNDN